ncbi:conserved hypothetical protein [Colletotrichum tofieldiae]|nr:conserved hypothetical protein [Colletotrichum tofieldiae]
MQRRSVADISLIDGMRIPVGSTISFARFASDKDSQALISDAHQFDGFRYIKLREYVEDRSKLAFASTYLNRFSFGSKTVPCPGRFYVGDLIKTVLAHIIQNYDIKYPEGQKRPQPVCFRYNLYPNPGGMILLRRRKPHTGH